MWFDLVLLGGWHLATARHCLRSTFEWVPAESPLPSAAEVGLYRIAQEALQNALLHAAASRVRLETDTETARLTVQDDGRGFSLGDALQAGAQGYLLKGAPREEIFTALRTVSAGGALIPPVVASKLLRQVRAAESPDALTPREKEVLGLVAAGHANREIATRLGISERTVKFHVSAILSKLGASNRTQAVRIAREGGLV